MNTQTHDAAPIYSQFEAAMKKGDAHALTALMTEDCTFENTFPAPDGTRVKGATAVSALMDEMFRSTKNPSFETEEIVTCGDRIVVRHKYSWDNADGTHGHVRGMDLMQLRDGKIREIFSYVKG